MARGRVAATSCCLPRRLYVSHFQREQDINAGPTCARRWPNKKGLYSGSRIPCRTHFEDKSMPHSFQVGSIHCHIVSDGQQLIDGGSFFGLVPRSICGSEIIRPDEKNRIPAQMRCLLIQSPSGLILVDSGQGDKITSEYRTEFGMDDSNLRLEADLRRVGCSPGRHRHRPGDPPARRPLRRQHPLERSQ